jgi:iron complex outermembrane receptor protein
MKSISVFGEATYDITDRFSFTGGVRYNHDAPTSYATLTFSPVPPTTIPLLGHTTFNSTTPRASLLFKATDRTNLYFTYSQGFKSGTYNTVTLQTAAVRPEKVRAYEAGIKSSEIESLTLSAAVFHYDYVDLQVPAFFTGPNGLLSQELTNAASAKITGAEVNATWSVTPELSLITGATYLHARYAHFPAASVNVPTGTGGDTTIQADVSGKTMIRSPDFSGNLTARYVKDTNVGTFDFSGTVYYSTKVFFEVSDRVVQPSYATVNASLAWRPNASNWQVRVWGKNITNHAVISNTEITTFSEDADYQPPRTFGFDIKYSF